MKKILLFKGDIETQGYFSEQMMKEFMRLGHDCFLFDLEKIKECTRYFLQFYEKGNTVLINFNFHGMSAGEYYFFDEDSGTYMWDDLKIPNYNIVVDHPYYYHEYLSKVPRGYHHISIDKNHEKYMHRFFPEIKHSMFLPLAGTQLFPEYKRVEERPIDVAFMGNYTPPSRFEKYITRIDDEYTAFYYGIIDDLLAHPERTLEDVVEEHTRIEIPDLTEEDLKKLHPNMIFIDDYIRYTVRGNAIKYLAESGIKVHLCGGGWDELDCNAPENLEIGQMVDSEECLRQMYESKICLNVMPWFKDGAHDRIFNTMLSGALSLTDSSVYLDTILKDGENCVIYSLTDLEHMPEKVHHLLAHPDEMQRIIDNGYKMAATGHTWAHRARVLSDYIEGITI